MYKIGGSWEAVLWPRELGLVPCDDLEGKEGRRGGRESRSKGRRSCRYTADSLCCTAEAQHCKAPIINLKKRNHPPNKQTKRLTL